MTRPSRQRRDDAGRLWLERFFSVAMWGCHNGCHGGVTGKNTLRPPGVMAVCDKCGATNKDDEPYIRGADA